MFSSSTLQCTRLSWRSTTVPYTYMQCVSSLSQTTAVWYEQTFLSQSQDCQNIERTPFFLRFLTLLAIFFANFTNSPQNTKGAFDWSNLAALDPDRAGRAARTAGSQSNGDGSSRLGVPSTNTIVLYCGRIHQITIQWIWIWIRPIDRTDPDPKQPSRTNRTRPKVPSLLGAARA